MLGGRGNSHFPTGMWNLQWVGLEAQRVGLTPLLSATICAYWLYKCFDWWASMPYQLLNIFITPGHEHMVGEKLGRGGGEN